MKLLIVDEVIIAGGMDTLRRQLVPELAKLVDDIVWVLPGYAAGNFREIAEQLDVLTDHVRWRMKVIKRFLGKNPK